MYVSTLFILFYLLLISLKINWLVINRKEDIVLSTL
jgi:hypothetical protein